MIGFTGNNGLTKPTSYKIVLPFYVYAAVSFLIATVLLFMSADGFTTHYFQPNTLAITHIMALGWGTMIILGASHQLVPVMIENKLYSEWLAYISFGCAALGIPILIYAFYTFSMGWLAQLGGHLVTTAIIVYLLNLLVSMAKSKHENVHAVFVFTAVVWLLATAIVGLLLIYNFTEAYLPKDSLTYLPLHAHMGIIGWFLLLIIGIGSRLLPMFLISKYDNAKKLWWIYGLINTGLLLFVVLFLWEGLSWLYYVPVLCIAAGVLLFGNFCYCAYRERIRKKVDEQMKVSLLSVFMILLPILLLLVIISFLMLQETVNVQLVITYGFVIFFGWITAIIPGMTFKTLPFIVWNKTYHHLAGKRKTPNPKDLFHEKVFKWMSSCYLLGFILFATGILINILLLLQAGAACLLLTSVFYNWNVLKLITHKAT